MFPTLSAEDFEPYQSTVFDAEGVPLTLARVERLAPQPHAPRHDPFTLLFTGPVNEVVNQRTYRLGHIHLGVVEIFLVPIGAGPEGPVRYEAVFN